MARVSTRREFLSRTFVASSVLLAGGSASRAAEESRPNIVVILADDMGFSDIGCYGGEIETPNLDRLAAHGIRFTQAYSAARCCPARASLLTGLYPHQTGIGHMTNEATRKFDYGFPGYRGELNRDCVTIAEVLGTAGYHTYMAGKWHVGTADGLRPLDRGFERFCGIVRGACNYFKPDPDKLLMRDRTPIPDVGEDFYTTDAFTDNAIQFVEEQANDRPFFLYLAYNAPHWPLNAKPEDTAKYRGRYAKGWDALRRERYRCQIDMGLLGDNCRLTERDPAVPEWDGLPQKRRDELAYRMALYAAQVDRMDQNIGRVLECLEKAKRLDNTLIVFLSDNGGCAEGGNWGGGPSEQLGTKEGYFLTYGRGWANASNTPFRRYKHWVHEGGIATPFIAHWPQTIPAELGGGFVRHPIHLIDIMATCVDAAEADYPTEFAGHAITPLEGRSIVPLLQGGSAPLHDTLYWEHEGNRAIREGRFKLVSAFHKGQSPWRLHDLESDRSETRDVLEEHPEVAAALAKRWDAWAARCGVVPWPAKPKE